MTMTDANMLYGDSGSGIAPFVRSKVFTSLFAHGMELVEETACYLDNGGREAAKMLSRENSLAYAGVSMRLTTRLMQIASWLLVLRAVRDAEMTEDEARDPKYRVGPSEDIESGARDMEHMPEELIDLIRQTDTLFARVKRLDSELFAGVTQRPEEDKAGDAKGRLEALARAFGSE